MWNNSGICAIPQWVRTELGREACAHEHVEVVREGLADGVFSLVLLLGGFLFRS